MVKTGVIAQDVRRDPLVRGGCYTLNPDYDGMGRLKVSDILIIDEPEIDVTGISAAVKAHDYITAFISGQVRVSATYKWINHPDETSRLKKVGSYKLKSMGIDLEGEKASIEAEIKFLSELEKEVERVEATIKV